MRESGGERIERKGNDFREGPAPVAISFDNLNELRGEAGKDPEPVEGSGAGDDGHGDRGVRFDVSTSSTHRGRRQGRTLSLSKGRGWGTTAAVISGFVSTGSMNSGGETGKDPELVEGSGAGDDGHSNLGVRFDRFNELRDGKVSESTFNGP